ncbi:Glutamate receptor 2.2 [Thalictrum thalictroides]|uniref:Glutamate receptor n=1 Tax=Thalictrum thalictroides TaxID=46969 RepID=A0A7J6WAY8_THATH|nr:Glutamate receptor 2.2 [Thalictrum thalictroides]
MKSFGYVDQCMLSAQAIGKVGWNCIQIALSDFYSAHSDYRTKMILHLRDSQGDNVQANLAVLDLLQNVEVQAILGPQKSSQADIVIDLGDKAQVPVISFSATSSSLSSRSPYFVQAAQSDSSQVKAIKAIIQTFKWREVVTIYENSDYGNGFSTYLIHALQEEQVKVPYKSVISLTATDDQIRLELYKLMNMHNRVFIVHMSNTLGSRLFLMAKEMEMMSEGYVWIITDGLIYHLDSMDETVIASMQGVLGVKPYIGMSQKLDSFTDRWKRKFRQDLIIYGLWAYDAIWILATAAERVGATKSPVQNQGTSNNLTDLTSIKTSRSGLILLNAILNTRIEGLTGDFYFANGKLQKSIYQILNVIGKGETGIGFWSSELGITKELSMSGDKTYTTSVTNLSNIKWPGDSLIVPKGWVLPTRGKKLRIGVPVNGGFNQIVKVDRDTETNKTKVTGYAIDVFDLVMALLPYPVPYEFEPFMLPNGSSAGSRYEMIKQVYLQRYDAVVGDTTITANRSLIVDFTLPFSEGGVAMMVLNKPVDKKSAWIFLQPLTKDLWLTTGAFFILTGFVIWVLEHRINKAFRGPPSQHVGMIFWFPLSTLVFAHRERIVSNLARLVVIIWIFVVLILNSSYTASLSSILTVEKLRPTVTTIEQLKKNGDYVGFQDGSFLPDMLKDMNFDPSKFKSYSSPEEMNEALQNGGQNGGITAFFATVPYIKLYTTKYCNRYTMVGPINKTEGFGFVFPRESPLVPDVSRALLKILETDKIKELDNALFGLQTTCSDPEHQVISHSLTLNSFRGLFAVTGTVSGVALIAFLVMFISKNKQVWTAMNSNYGISEKLKTMLRQFDEKDTSSYPFSSRAHTEREGSVEVRVMDTSPSFTTESIYTDGSRSSPFERMVSIHLDDFLMSAVALEELDDIRLSE